MNLLKTRIYVIKNISSGQYLAEFKVPMIHYPIPEMEWGPLSGALLFNSRNELRNYIKDKPLLLNAVSSGKLKLLSVLAELHIDKIVDLTRTIKKD